MNIEEALESLGEALDEPPVDIEAGRERLRAAVRRLQDDPQEARRIDDLAKLVDRREKDYRLAHEALRKEDFDTAEHLLRRIAEHGNDEAAYWLGLLLELRSIRHRLKGRPDKARKLATEAREWRLRAQESGIADALDETLASDTAPQPPGPARPEAPLAKRRRGSEQASEDATEPPAQQASSGAPPAHRAPSGGQGCYAVGIEVQPFRFTAMLVNGNGEIISEQADDLPNMEAEAVTLALADAAREIVASKLGQEFPGDQVALGVQLGGPVNTKTGTVHYFSKHPPNIFSKASDFRWDDFPLGPRLQKETGFQTVIVNDAVAFAERERWLGVGQQTGDFAVMLIREGVGGAVVSDGEHFKGPVEIGNFRFHSNSFDQGDTDQYGILELDGGTTGIIKSASELAGRPLTSIGAAVEAACEDSAADAAAAAFLSAGVAIACGLSYLIQFAGPTHVVMFAPEVMLGPDNRATRRFLGQVRKFREAVAFEAFRKCALVLRPIDLNDGAQGAALTALNRCFGVRPETALISAGAMR